MKNHKITITLSHDDFSMLEKLCVMGTRNKSGAIAWLILQEWERLQELEGIKKAAVYIAPYYDTRIIQFPERQIR